jgi:hypothetical protein
VADTFDEQVISEFRARGGVVSGLQDLSLLLLHHFGAKSGTERVTPLAFWSVSNEWPTQRRPWKSGQRRGRLGPGWRLPTSAAR